MGPRVRDFLVLFAAKLAWIRTASTFWCFLKLKNLKSLLFVSLKLFSRRLKKKTCMSVRRLYQTRNCRSHRSPYRKELDKRRQIRADVTYLQFWIQVCFTADRPCLCLALQLRAYPKTLFSCEFSLLWPWALTYDLDLRIWTQGQHELSSQTSKSQRSFRSSYCTDSQTGRQTDRQTHGHLYIAILGQ